MSKYIVTSKPGMTPWSHPATARQALEDQRAARMQGLDGDILTTTTCIADGIYFLHPEGSSWTAAKFRGGRMVAWTDASLADTHRAANDYWSDTAPDETDVELSAADALPIIREVMGSDTYPEMVIVTRPV